MPGWAKLESWLDSAGVGGGLDWPGWVWISYPRLGWILISCPGRGESRAGVLSFGVGRAKLGWSSCKVVRW